MNSVLLDSSLMLAKLQIEILPIEVSTRTERFENEFLTHLSFVNSMNGGFVKSDSIRFSNTNAMRPLVYACATIWHENNVEMIQLLVSLIRYTFFLVIRCTGFVQHKKGIKKHNKHIFTFYKT